ncbi:hypothetical protein HD806DRAFT_505084 [Xylariaceae sp. AK1471]|nr:hypothetical protein HD806DRAFT_505084 [Xylariaceae sp. AK1471]
MPSGQAASTSDSLSKKRARDRRAQHNLRKKRDAYVHGLQQRITDLENELQSFRIESYGLRRENELLNNRQPSAWRLVTSWANPWLPQVVSSRNPFSSAANANGLLALGSGDATHEGGSSQGLKPYVSLALPVSPTQTLESARSRPQTTQDLTSPRWKTIPVHLNSDVAVTNFFGLWMGKPDMVHSSPDVPRPIELLYGSKTNLLAHAIYTVARSWPYRDPERLAAGMLTYSLIKWMSEPSESSFSLLQEFQHPVSEQICTPHPHFIDYVMWPGLRVNMIKNQHVYDPHDVISVFTCCLKVRWPWNEPILEPGDEGELMLRAEFRETFTRLDGWGLTKEFWDRYPLLCQGLDVASFRYDFT